MGAFFIDFYRTGSFIWLFLDIVEAVDGFLMYINGARGKAFERWVKDVLEKYCSRISLTKHNEHYDIVFDFNERHNIVECKLISYSQKSGKKNSLCLRKKQMEALKGSKSGLDGANEVWVVIGVLFGEGDVVPFVFSIDEALERGIWKDKKGRCWLQMSSIMKGKHLRVWVEERFGEKSLDVKFPSFASYVGEER
jgi:hypothetical protein